jgi:hypothetical protein
MRSKKCLKTKKPVSLHVFLKVQYLNYTYVCKLDVFRARCMKYLEKINFPRFENNDFVVVLDVSHVKNEVKKVFKNKKAGFHCTFF